MRAISRRAPASHAAAGEQRGFGVVDLNVNEIVRVPHRHVNYRARGAAGRQAGGHGVLAGHPGKVAAAMCAGGQGDEQGAGHRGELGALQEAGPLNGNVSPARQPYLIGAQSVREGLAARNSCLYQFMFGGVESPRQALHTEAAWSISGEAGAYQDAGLHI